MGRHTVDDQTAAIATERLARLLDDLTPRRATIETAIVETGLADLADLADTAGRAERADRAEPPGRAGAAGGPQRSAGSHRARYDQGGTDRTDTRGPSADRLATRAQDLGRRHLGVIAIVLAVGIVAAGWALLRARPVALATPVSVSTTAPASRSGVESSDVNGASGAASTGAGSTGAGSTGAGSTSAASTSVAGKDTPSPRILVHVVGAVHRPGVVELPERARVQDAIDAAGGLAGGARPGELNLAQVLQDGQQVVIGSARDPGGEVRDTSAGAGSDPTGSGSASRSAGGTSSGGTVDLNSATLAQLDTLPGVGPVTAERILAWRSEHGRFSRIEELQEIDGIGPKTYARIAPHVRV